MANKKTNDALDHNQKEAKRILDRVERESETVATSSMARTSDQFKTLQQEKNGTVEEDDPIEILGKKIGRGLGWIAMIILAIYLFNTYIAR